jgi:hypothetical protein
MKLECIESSRTLWYAETPVGSGTTSGVARPDRGGLLNTNRRRGLVPRQCTGQPEHAEGV